jgi:L-iditol 2-dehydrogenase
VFAGQIAQRQRIRLIDTPEPSKPASEEVIVRLETGCLCGSDVALFVSGQPRYPLTVGLSLHELVGRVIDSRSARFRVGDRVVAYPPDLRGLVEYLKIREEQLVAIRSNIPGAVAGLAQPLGTVLSALRKLPNVIGQRVAVVGQGPIGQLFAMCMARFGARDVVGLDLRSSRLEHATSSGATHTVCTSMVDPVAAVEEITDGAMMDLVVEAVGHQTETFNLCVNLCRRDGRLLYFGVPPHTMNGIGWGSAFRKNLTVSTSVGGNLVPDIALALNWIERGAVNVAPLITHTFNVADVQKAFGTYSDRNANALKVVMDFETNGTR